LVVQRANHSFIAALTLREADTVQTHQQWQYEQRYRLHMNLLDLRAAVREA